EGRLISFHSASFLGTVDGACDPKAAKILGGNYILLEDGTGLTYECPQGQYPHPTRFRFCNNGNQWSLLTDREGRTVEKAECRAIRCVRPLEFENGVFETFQQFYEINQELKFTCYDGHKLRGPQIRTCLPTGKWSGETAVCDDGTGHCPDPGIPIGTRKYGTEYQPGSTVRYQCSRGLSLIGSKERVCQKSGIWSGSEPECRSEGDGPGSSSECPSGLCPSPVSSTTTRATLPLPVNCSTSPSESDCNRGMTHTYTHTHTKHWEPNSLSPFFLSQAHSLLILKKKSPRSSFHPSLKLLCLPAKVNFCKRGRIGDCSIVLPGFVTGIIRVSSRMLYHPW
uniref:Sushi domain-containing protein n=1 Tax=Pseudonaja textilis TaxID=8673 RepID=A0A670ZCU5_PSETE